MKDDFNSSSADRMAGILTRLAQVPDGAAVVDFLKLHDVEFDLQEDPANWAASTLTITDVKEGLYYYIDPVIILKKDLSDDNLLQAIIHETQHLNQHFSHVGNPDRILSDAQYILFYRASEADAQALCTEVAWQLKQAGDDGPWKAAGFVGYQDVCDAYEKAATEDPASTEDGRARRAAFDAWFSSAERLASYNKATVDHMIPFLEEGRTEYFPGHGMVKKPLDADWLKKLDEASLRPCMFLQDRATVLEDPMYSRDMDTRPPEPKKKPANENAAHKPPKVA